MPRKKKTDVELEVDSPFENDVEPNDDFDDEEDIKDDNWELFKEWLVQETFGFSFDFFGFYFVFNVPNWITLILIAAVVDTVLL